MSFTWPTALLSAIVIVNIFEYKEFELLSLRSIIMSGCLKGKSKADKKDAKFVCKKCGAYAMDKKHMCKPEKNKKKD